MPGGRLSASGMLVGVELWPTGICQSLTLSVAQRVSLRARR